MKSPCDGATVMTKVGSFRYNQSNKFVDDFGKFHPVFKSLCQWYQAILFFLEPLNNSVTALYKQ